MTLRTTSLAALTALALIGVSAPVLAEQISFTANLVGTEELPPSDSPASGMLDATYDTDSNVLTFNVSYSGLTGDATAAHFHGPAAVGEKAPPVVPIDGSLASPIAGSATLTDAQEADLEAGKWYFNVHTAQYPDGEIRGQVMQSGMSGESSMMSDMSSSEMSSMPSSEMSSEASSAEADSSSGVSSMESSAMSDVSSIESSALSDSSSIDASTSVDVSASADVSVSADTSSVDVSASTDISASGLVSVQTP